MRKVIVVLLLAALGGSLFFLGWASFAVPPGTCAVMRSKTHGIDPAPLQEGSFRWVWYKLIPANVVITPYTLRTVEVPLLLEGSLPSTDLYRSLSGLSADFSYKIEGALSFSLRPASLPALAAAQHITGPAELRAYEDRLSAQIRDFVLQRLWKYAEDGAKLNELLGLEPPQELLGDLAAAFPDIERLTCTLRALHLPDTALYRSIQALHQDYLARQRTLLQEDLNALSEQRLSSFLRLEELTKYGELFTQYPMLLDYLALE